MRNCQNHTPRRTWPGTPERPQFQSQFYNGDCEAFVIFVVEVQCLDPKKDEDIRRRSADCSSWQSYGNKSENELQGSRKSTREADQRA